MKNQLFSRNWRSIISVHAEFRTRSHFLHQLHTFWCHQIFSSVFMSNKSKQNIKHLFTFSNKLTALRHFECYLNKHDFSQYYSIIWHTWMSTNRIQKQNRAIKVQIIWRKFKNYTCKFKYKTLLVPIASSKMYKKSNFLPRFWSKGR